MGIDGLAFAPVAKVKSSGSRRAAGDNPVGGHGIIPSPHEPGDPDRLVRFEREAHVLASLNHPHIAQIYGVEESSGVLALIMELVDGETLADLLRAPGGIAADDALDIGRQIAEALETAHDQGIVHRDLKPANVKVRPDGTVKVLDFGLAKAMGAEAGGVPSSINNSPTFTSPAVTQLGVILGTAAYMAPEQARGKVVDRRVDIWAFGCVLFEMLTGRRPFEGETVTDVLSAIVSRDPDWRTLPANVRRPVVQLMKRCLQKDARKRLRDIGEARLILEASDVTDAALEPATGPRRSQPVAWMISGVTTGIAVIALAWASFLIQRPRSSTPSAVTRFDVQMPDPASALTLVFRPSIALSADGRALAFVAASAGVDHVYVRRRAETSVWMVPRSDRGTNPTLSPDGTSVAFFADGQIRKAAVDGEPTSIGTVSDARGMTWTDDGMLVVAPDSATPLMIMPAAGGPLRQVTKLAQGERTGERTHRWPQALPGGKAVLFTVGTFSSPDSYDKGNIDAVVTATGERRVVIAGSAMACYCGDGHLLFTRGGALYSIAFDPDRLATSGDAVQVASAVARDASTGAAHFTCASDGTLAYVPGSSLSELRQLFWADEQGRMQSLKLPPGPHQEVRISPDSRYAALLGGNSLNGDVWLLEFASGTFRRLTFTSTNSAPIWSGDSLNVYFTSFDSARNVSTVMKKPADGSRDAVALGTIEGRAFVAWVDATETVAIVDMVDPATDHGDIVRLSLGPSSSAQKLVGGPANDYCAAVSPNGRWLAYQSDETGRQEVHVLDLGRIGARWQVTTEGGEEPHWSADGRHLFYRSSNRLMTVPLEAGASFRYGSSRPLFEAIYNSGIASGRSYDVDPKGGRFLLVRPADTDPLPRAVRVTLNWPLDLPRK